MFSISPVSLSSPAYRSSNISRSNVAFAGKGKLSQEKIDEFRRKFDIDDPISPDNTSKTYSEKRWITEYSTLVGAPSAAYKVLKGSGSYSNFFQRLKDSANRFLTGQETQTIVGLDHKTFISAKEAEAYKTKVNASPPNYVPYMVAFHPADSRKVLTFITNSPQKAAELREKAKNPFDDVSISSGSSRNSIDEPRPSTSHVEEEDNPFASPEDATASRSRRSASPVANPFAHEDDEEDPFKD